MDTRAAGRGGHDVAALMPTTGYAVRGSQRSSRAAMAAGTRAGRPTQGRGSMRNSRFVCYLTLALGLLGFAHAGRGQQQPSSPKDEDPRATYVLGPDDQITIRAVDPEETADRPVRIDMAGYIRLPMVGRVKAAGLTVEQLEHALDERLKPYLVEPDVSVFVVEFRSQPVSVLGAVKSPGIVQLQGHKTLVEVLSLAGGLNDDAGHSIKITRRLEQGRIPLPNATDDPTGTFSVAEVSVKEIMEAQNPAENIVICPQDVISVPRGQMVYVIGDVTRAGGYVLRERESLSVLQALALAGGLGRGASPKNARILRSAPGETKRTEIPVDLKKIIGGRSGDLALQSDDILFIPASPSKQALARGAEAAVAVTTGVAIYRF
jgi:polysaccharide export outer membrane protein